MTPGLITRGKAAPASSVVQPVAALRPNPPVLVLPRWAAALAITALLCLLCGLMADAPVARLVARAPAPMLRLAALFSALGNSNYMLAGSAAIVAFAYAVRRRGSGIGFGRPIAVVGERAVFVFTTVAVSGLLAQAVKHLVGRARPKLLDTAGPFHFDLFSIKASLASFPSGHTASAFGLALALGLMERRLLAPLLVMAGLVAAARVALGAHYLSDVVAGAALGSAVTLALASAFARRDLAFACGPGRIVLKGDGTVWPALLTLAGHRDRSA